MSTSQLPSKILPSATVSSPSLHPREITSLVLVINSAAAATTRTYEMKIPLHNCDGKVFTIEEGTPSIQVSHESKTERVANYFKLLKWFVAINILILLLFCGYALWSFYQLEIAMQTREGAINLNRYFKRYDANSMRKTTTIGDVKVRDIDGTVVISDFQEWQKFILSSLENLEDNVSYNLKFLLHSITSIVKNFVENDKARATDSELKLQNVSNSPTLLNNKLIMTNLTDFEIHILKEFIKLKMLENNGTERSRFSRTAESVKDESECDLHLTFVVSNDKPIRVLIKPEKTEGAINESNDLNDLPINETNKENLKFDSVNT